MSSFSQLLRQLEAMHSAETARLQSEINRLRAESMQSYKSEVSEVIYEGSSRDADLAKTETGKSIINLDEDFCKIETSKSKANPDGDFSYTETSKSMVNAKSTKSAVGSNMSVMQSIKSATSVYATPVLRGSFLKNIGIAAAGLIGDDADTVFEKDGRCLGRLHLFVRGPLFESFFASLIFANALIMAAEAQFESVGVEIDLGLAIGRSSNAWPRLSTFFAAMGYIFGGLFTLEIILKVVGLRWNFVRELWNWIDLAIVIVWLIGSLESSLGQAFRLFRLVRLIRLLRLVRTIQSFDSLYLMTTALKGSVSVLAWGACLLFVIELLLALLFTQLLSEHYFADASIDLAKRVLVFEYFGSFLRSFFTLFQLTLGTWAEPSRILIENISEWFILFTLAHKLMVGFAVIGVINGVFMQETFKVAAIDDMLMLRQKQRAMAIHAKKMRYLFDAVDTDGRGYIDYQQFRLIMTEPRVKTWLASMELSTDDVERLYGLLDDGDQKLCVEELIAGVAHLKGPARSIDLAVLTQQFKNMEKTIHELARTHAGSSRVYV